MVLAAVVTLSLQGCVDGLHCGDVEGEESAFSFSDGAVSNADVRTALYKLGVADLAGVTCEDMCRELWKLTRIDGIDRVSIKTVEACVDDFGQYDAGGEATAVAGSITCGGVKSTVPVCY